jgi:hypothetical protein
MQGAWTERGLVYTVYTSLNCIKHRHILTVYYRLILTKERPDLSSERAPHRDMAATFRQ